MAGLQSLVTRGAAGTYLVAQAAATAADGAMVGGLPVGSVLNFGGAGLLFAAVIYFLNFLKVKDERDALKDEKAFKALEESQQRYQAQVERLFDRQEQLVRSFQSEVIRITSGQNELMGDVTRTLVALETTVKAVQESQAGSANAVKAIDAAIRATDTSVGSLRAGMTTLEVLVRSVVVHLPPPARAALFPDEPAK